jgi:NAD(P)-dependent dehydrogenase (short-subunit alcohol dehydrogenase family)
MADHLAPLLITGASRGIGEATARLFAQKGHRVALLARRAAAIESLADEIGGFAVPCDVADEMAVEQAVHKSATEFGRIGIIINNAGTLEPAARILDTDPRDWTRNIEINLFGPLYVLRHAVSLLPKGGVVIKRVPGRSSKSARGLERLLRLKGWTFNSDTRPCDRGIGCTRYSRLRIIAGRCRYRHAGVQSRQPHQ